jgi:threonine synthase
MGARLSIKYEEFVMTLIYQSTRDENNKVTASQAILQGLATDGGLFTPTSLPEVALDFDALKDASYHKHFFRYRTKDPHNNQ